MTPKQCRMARAGLNWTVRELGLKASVMPNTVTNFEKDRGVNSSTIKAIKAAFLETGLVKFNGDNCVCVEE
ncbi:MAG: transcriptional regulator [Burkholderiales bacterium]|nr:transcriptional regulator [Burkholderiales bacterium]